MNIMITAMYFDRAQMVLIDICTYNGNGIYFKLQIKWHISNLRCFEACVYSLAFNFMSILMLGLFKLFQKF